MVGVTSNKYFDISCFTFIVFFRDYFCLAIELITKHYECSFYFPIILLFFMSISWGFVRVRDVDLRYASKTLGFSISTSG